MHAIRDRARRYAKDEKPQSSILSSFLPSASFDWFRPNARPDETKFTTSDSFKWKSKSFSCKDRPLDMEHNDEHETEENTGFHEENGKPVGGHVENGEPGSGTSTSNSSDVFEDVSTTHTLEKSCPRLLDESLFVSRDLYQFFEASLPNIVKGCEWVLLYRAVRQDMVYHFTRLSGTVHILMVLVYWTCTFTEVDYSSGTDGVHNLSGTDGITGDKQGAVFGGLLDCPLKPTAKRKYQGTNQSFVFTTLYGEPRLFGPTGANRYFYLCLDNLLALGGGANFALSLNEDLLSGTSGPCETFGNSCLAHDHEFELKNVELWGFTHASQYLN
ncbi:hypothetical protein OROGR_009916 [Orobanche gracilis]